METQSRNGRDNRQAATHTPFSQEAGELAGTERQTAAAERGARGATTTQTGTRTSPTRRPQGELATDAGHPFNSMLQLSREVDRLWDSLFGRPFGGSRLATAWPLDMGQGTMADRGGNSPTLWSPRIDLRYSDDAVTVHADLPGCRKEDVRIEATEEGIAISGERNQQREEGEAGKGYRFSERTYGSFYRSVPLPEGASVEQAKARMADGVLEVTIPLQQPQRRQISIE